MPLVNLTSAHKYVIGIDFGHGETSAAIACIHSSELKDVDLGCGKKNIPSAILIRENDGEREVYIGHYAISEFEESYDEKTDTFKCSFKEIPSSLTKHGEDVLKSFFKSVYDTILSKNVFPDINKDNHVVAIACPSNKKKWTDGEVELYRKLASDAGLPIVCYQNTKLPEYHISGIVRESRAAYIKAQKSSEKANYVHGGALTIDFGSSTVDLTYYNPNNNIILDYGTEKDLGAQKVELAIFNHLCNLCNPCNLCNKYASLKRISDAITKKDTNIPNYEILENAYYALLLKIRFQKENYYKGVSGKKLKVELDLFDATHGLYDEKINERISSDELDVLLTEYKNDIIDDFTKFKKEHLNDLPVSMLILTGGASHMGFIRDISETIFNPNMVEKDTDPEFTISRGVTLAGQADINVARLLEKLLRDNSIANAAIWAQVKEQAANNLADAIIKDMQNRYTKLKNGEVKTIKVLSEDMKAFVSQLNHNAYLNSSYADCLFAYINSSVYAKLKTILTEFFPAIPQSRIQQISTNSQFNIEFDNSLIGAISLAVSNSVSQIADGFLRWTFKTMLNLGLLSIDGAVKLIDSAASLAEKGVRKLAKTAGLKADWNQIFGNYDFGKLTEALFVKYRDEDTELNEAQREKVYDIFISNKENYKRDLINSIQVAIGDSAETKVNTSARIEIRKYIISSISSVRLLLN